jgi:AraC-like DNA-binding protein
MALGLGSTRHGLLLTRRCFLNPLLQSSDRYRRITISPRSKRSMDDCVSRFRISTGGFDGPDALDAFRETHGRVILRLEINPTDGVPLDVDMRFRSLPGLGVAFCRSSPTRNEHTTSLIDSDDFVLVVMTSGSRCFQHAKREGTIGPGEAVLTTAGEVGTFFGGWSSNVAFRLSRDIIVARIPAPDDALGRVIPATSPVLSHMLSYAQLLDSENAINSAALGRSIVAHVHELATLTLEQDVDVLSRADGVRAARLHAVRMDIIGNIAQHDLRLDDVAKRQRISRSYVSKLLAEAGTSFTEMVLTQRLAFAYRLLTDPRQIDKPVSSIAYEAGFSDLSYFNRSFRRKFGTTPSDLRGRTRDETDR